jgi:hypothetical protein
MPVSLPEVHAVGLKGSAALLAHESDAIHSLLLPSSKLWFLADIIPLGPQHVVSLGDLFILLGLAGVIVEGGWQAAETQRTWKVPRTWLTLLLAALSALLWGGVLLRAV